MSRKERFLTMLEQEIEKGNREPQNPLHARATNLLSRTAKYGDYETESRFAVKDVVCREQLDKLSSSILKLPICVVLGRFFLVF